MKKLIIIFTALTLILLISCSEKKIVSDSLPNSSIEGRIAVVDNAPFSKLALQINDSTMYLLECKNEIKDSLLNKQGELYKIYFDKKLETELGTKIIVTKIEQIQK